MSEPGWITNGELVREYVRPPSQWDDQVERIAIYLYRAERAWAQAARWLDAGTAVRKDPFGWIDLAEDEKAAWRNAGQAEVRDGE